jgi:glutamine synthetase
MHTPVKTPERTRGKLRRPESNDTMDYPPINKLERLLGKPASAWAVEDLLRLCREQNIQMLSLMHVGGDGWLKTLDFVPQDETHFRNILAGGERADGSSLFGGSGIKVGASDILLRPRIESAFLDPFAECPVLVFLCGHYTRTGEPLPESPDTIVRCAAGRLKSVEGVDLYAHAEVEYYLGKRRDESDIYGTDDRGYHASSPFVFGEALRREALLLLAEIGVPIKYGHAEVGYVESGSQNDWLWEQHEIELALQPLPRAAESVVLTHWVLRNLAQQRDFQCSFAPVLVKGHAGSGMHFHLSPLVHGEFIAPIQDNKAPGDAARWLIGGLVKHGGTLMAFGNRADSSFLRLSQAKEAPNTVTWGRFDRRALVRLPIVARDEHGRQVTPQTIEFRLPDGSAHPHLLLAAIAQAMTAAKTLPDLDKLIAATAAEHGGRHRQMSTIPQSRAEIADRLHEDRRMLEAGDVFPSGMLDSLIESFQRP